MPIRSINANALPAQSNLAVGNQRNGNRGYNNQTHAVSNDPVYISNVVSIPILFKNKYLSQ